MNKYRHIHFIGIGGIGMSGIALIMLRQGFRVTGSDLKESRITIELRLQGAEVFIGHNADNIKGADLIVYSSAIKEENLEFIQAKKMNVVLIKRAEALAKLMRNQDVITVGGSHGKTTTSSLVACLLTEAGFCPTAVIGGIARNFDANACIGDGKYFVAEADESDGSFLCYTPKFSIITNIDYEHLDYYKNFAKELEAFTKFVYQTKNNGCIFACGDDVNLRKILNDYGGKNILFGLGSECDISAKNIKIKGLTSQFDCYDKDKFIDTFNLALGGMHNVSNALSVIALGRELGIDNQTIKNALNKFKGTGRRIEIKFEDKDILLIDDYAHHPTEIKATLEAVKNIGRRRIVVIFQPHRYTRTELLLDEFGKCFDLADELIITDIYAASEPPIEGVNAKNICKKIIQHSAQKHVEYVPKDRIIQRIMEIKKPGDLVITLGAGDIIKTCDELVEKLQNKF